MFKRILVVAALLACGGACGGAWAQSSGIVTASAPNYTPYTGGSAGLSLDQAGGLRVSGTITTTCAGCATAANQATQITAEQATQASAANIDTKTPALGQALSAASTPVVLPATQITTLTPPTSVTVTQATGTNLHAVLDATSTTAVTNATASNLNAQVQGAGATGAAVTGNPVLQAGSDGTNARTITTDASGNQIGVGPSASGVAAVGNPIGAGGTFLSAYPSLSTGQRQEFGLTTHGQLLSMLVGIAATGSDGIANTVAYATHNAAVNTSVLLTEGPLWFNGTTWDRARSGGVTGIEGVSLQASPSGAYTYNHIATAATTTVKSGAGTLHTITINSLGTVASTLTVYDNTAGSGTVIGIINSLSITGTLTLDVAFA